MMKCLPFLPTIICIHLRFAVESNWSVSGFYRFHDSRQNSYVFNKLAETKYLMPPRSQSQKTPMGKKSVATNNKVIYFLFTGV